MSPFPKPFLRRLPWLSGLRVHLARHASGAALDESGGQGFGVVVVNTEKSQATGGAILYSPEIHPMDGADVLALNSGIGAGKAKITLSAEPLPVFGDPEASSPLTPAIGADMQSLLELAEVVCTALAGNDGRLNPNNICATCFRGIASELKGARPRLATEADGAYSVASAPSETQTE